MVCRSGARHRAVGIYLAIEQWFGPCGTPTTATPEQVAVPQGWYDVAKVVNNSPLVGKAIALPLIDFYQIPTTWGFYGADNLVRQLVKRPVAARSPDTYVTDNQAYESIMRSVELSVRSGDAEALRNLLRSLGVSHVIVRKDIDMMSPIRLPKVTPAELLLASLRAMIGVRVETDNDVAAVFTWPQDRVEPVQALIGVLAAESFEEDTLASVLASVPAGLAASDVPTGLDIGQIWTSGSQPSGSVFDAAAPGSFEVHRRAETAPVFVAETTVDSAGAALVLREAVAFDLADATLPRRPEIHIPTTAKALAFSVNGRLVEPDGPRSAMVLDGPTVITPYLPDPTRRPWDSSAA